MIDIKHLYRMVLKSVELMIYFTDMDKPFTFDERDEEYGLWCPSSKACFLILWLYSIEPPLYSYLNKACRQMDVTMLSMLGPWARALYEIVCNAECSRVDTP